MIAQIFLMRAAVETSAAGEAEPRHPDAHAGRQPVDAIAQRLDAADDFLWPGMIG